jgi:YfiH family protein
MEFELHEDGAGRWFVSPLLMTDTGPAHAFGALPSAGAPPPRPESVLLSIGCGEAVPVTLRQVHGTEIHVVENNRGFPRAGDGLVTEHPALAPAVRTSDCVPLLLRDPDTGAVAAVHAGRRGMQAGIIHSAVERMAARGAEPRRLLAAVGPSIGVCCYEVGPEVAASFEPEVLRAGRDDRARLDLWEAARLRLEAAGLSRERIAVARLCTCCNPDLFPSYRRDGTAGRGAPSLIVANGPG